MDNELDVVFVPVHKAPVVTVQVWYHVGSKDEPRDRRGSAHMFEHMMFKGTRNVPPEEHARLLDQLGGTVTAFTTEAMTGSHNTLPKQYMDFAMKLEAERMRNLLFRPKMIDTEREVVKEEIRQQENNPIAKAFLKFRELAFEKHPYAWTAGGKLGDLDATSPEDLKRFYDLYYHPNNATLVVVGDVTREEVAEAAERHFGSIPKGPAPPRPADEATEPEQTAMRRFVTDDRSQVGVIIGGYKVPSIRDDDIYALEVLSNVLSGGESSRLHQRIVRKDKTGVGAGSFLQAMEHPGLFLVFGVYLQPDQGKKVEEAILDEISRLHARTISPREIEKARNQLASQLVFGLQSVEGLAFQVGASAIQRGDPTAWVKSYEKYLAVTPADVQRVARTYLVPEKLTLVVVPPAGGAQ